MADDRNLWASDVPISMPVPSDDMVLVNMGAHGFTVNGLVHNINWSRIEELAPAFAPPESG